ncbi:MAG: YihY/virulence factor BrkB family protein [Armatimonadetes bacterium]|nr:YihY/virulence factor BrkB family protein [Armatimonadota bacterium]
MVIGRLILAFINAVSRVFTGVRPPKEVIAEMPPPPKPVKVENAAASTPTDELHSSDLSQVSGVVGYGKELFKRFTGDQCPAWAASLSFFSIISLPSVLLCGLAVIGFLIKSPQEAAAKVEQVITQLLPGQTARRATLGDTDKKPTAASKETAKGILQELNIEKSVEEIRERRGWTAFIGIGLLLWSAIQIFVNASTPINAAFQAKETRNFFQLRLTALGLLFGTGILFVLSLLPAAGVQVINSLRVFGTLPDPLPLAIQIVFWAMAIAVNALLFTVIYRFLPSPTAKVSWRDASFGGITAAVLWELAKQGFALYLQRLGGAESYNKLYGSLGSIFLLIFWIYYTSMILLLGAEIAKLYGDVQNAKKVPATP